MNDGSLLHIHQLISHRGLYVNVIVESAVTYDRPTLVIVITTHGCLLHTIVFKTSQCATMFIISSFIVFFTEAPHLQKMTKKVIVVE